MYILLVIVAFRAIYALKMFQFISSSRPSLIVSQIFAIRVTSSSVCQFTSRNVHVSTHLVVKREERMNNQGIKIIKRRDSLEESICLQMILACHEEVLKVIE